jgi:hypothetical protein
MMTRKSVAARPWLAFVIAVVAAAAGPARAAPLGGAIAPHFNDKLDVRSAPRIRKAISVVEAYLDAVDADLAAAPGGTIRHTISGAYGSGFLRHNPVGNDLDYFVNVDLGSLSVDPDGLDLAAGEILRRFDVYRHAAQARAERDRTPALAVSRFMDGIPGTALDQDAEARRQVSASLGHVLANRPYMVGNVYRGVSQVSPMDAGEGYLPLVANAQFFSDVVDHSARVFWGIRGVSLQFFFSVELKVAGAAPRWTPLSTLAPPRQVGKLWQQAFSGVFASAAAAATFEATVLASTPMSERRLQYAQGFLPSLVFERQVRKYPIKFVKRLHSLTDSIAPLLSPAQQRDLDALFVRELNRPAATDADQIKTFGETLRSMGRQRELIRLFSASGDLDRVIAYLRRTAARLRHNPVPAVRDKASALEAPLAGLTAAPDAASEAALEPFVAAAQAVASTGLEMVQQLGLDEDAMGRLWEEAEALFRRLGFVPVRLYPQPDATVAVHPDDLACGGRARGVLDDLRAEYAGVAGPPAPAPSLSPGPSPSPSPSAASRGSGDLSAGVGRPARPFVHYVRCSSDPGANARYLTALRTLAPGPRLATTHRQ